jgi:hypothetical protein
MHLNLFLAYILVANPGAYALTRRVFGKLVASTEGQVTLFGLLLHAVVLVLLLSLLPRASYAYSVPKAPGGKTVQAINHLTDQRWNMRLYHPAGF